MTGMRALECPAITSRETGFLDLNFFKKTRRVGGAGETYQLCRGELRVRAFLR